MQKKKCSTRLRYKFVKEIASVNDGNDITPRHMANNKRSKINYLRKKKQ